MPAIVQPGTDNVFATGERIVTTDVNYKLDKYDDKVIALVAALTLTLPDFPSIGESHKFAAEEGPVTIVGGAYPLSTSVNSVLLQGQGADLTFTGTKWVPTDSAGGEPWASQPNWFVNALLGDDKNVGDAPGAGALKTFGEFNRRTRGQTLTSPITTVTIQTDLPPSDPISYDVGVTPGSLFLVVGEVATVATGAFTATADQDPATNQRFEVTDPAVASWATYRVNRLRCTSNGPPITAWLAEDLGANTAALTPWGLRVSPDGFEIPFSGPIPGTTYVIEKLPEVTDGEKTVRAGFNSSAAILDLRFVGAPASNIQVAGSAGTFGGFGGCAFEQTQFNIGYRFATANFNCLLEQGLNLETGPMLFSLGGVVAGPFGPNSADVQVGQGAMLALNHTLMQGSPGNEFDIEVTGTLLLLNPAGFFQCAHALQLHESTVHLDGGGKIIAQRFGFFGETGWVPLWGADNLKPIAMGTGSSIEINQRDAVALPTIDNLESPGLPVSFGHCNAVPTNAHAFDQATAAYGAAVGFTWAGLNVAFPGGFLTQVSANGNGANASDPGLGSRVTWCYETP